MMKKNRQITNQVMGMFFLALSLLLVSCGSFQTTSYYGDGIYGEELPLERTERVVYSDTDREFATDPNYYRNYFNTIALKGSDVESYFSDVDSYKMPSDSDTQSVRTDLGQNKPNNITVNVYGNHNYGYNPWEYSPYYYDQWNYGNTHYWGMGAWFPYYDRFHRGGFHIGYNWNYGWDYPYEYGYHPYYYNRGYYYYPYYGNVYRNSKNYAYIKGRRGSNNTYSGNTYNNRNSSHGESNGSYSKRSYQRGSGTYTPTQRSYERISTRTTTTPSSVGRTYNDNSSSTNRNSYESGNFSSGRTYTPSNSSFERSYSRDDSSSSSGRTYSTGRRGR